MTMRNHEMFCSLLLFAALIMLFGCKPLVATDSLEYVEITVTQPDPSKTNEAGPAPTQITTEPTDTQAPSTPSATSSPYSDEELAAQGTYTYQPPEYNVEDPCWVARFQSSRNLRFDFQSPVQLEFDPSASFFVSYSSVEVIVQMNRSDSNTWIGSFKSSIDDYNFSVSEEIVFEEDGIIWYETITNARPGYYSNTIVCGPAKWTRIP